MASTLSAVIPAASALAGVFITLAGQIILTGKTREWDLLKVTREQRLGAYYGLLAAIENFAEVKQMIQDSRSELAELMPTVDRMTTEIAQVREELATAQANPPLTQETVDALASRLQNRVADAQVWHNGRHGLEVSIVEMQGKLNKARSEVRAHQTSLALLVPLEKRIRLADILIAVDSDGPEDLERQREDLVEIAFRDLNSTRVSRSRNFLRRT